MVVLVVLVVVLVVLVLVLLAERRCVPTPLYKDLWPVLTVSVGPQQQQSTMQWSLLLSLLYLGENNIIITYLKYFLVNHI